MKRRGLRTGNIEARRFELLSRLRLQGVSILQRLGYRPCSSRDLMVLCRQLSTMLRSGITAPAALKLIAGHGDLKIFTKSLLVALASLEEGSSLSKALWQSGDLFPPLLISVVAAGEAGGMLDRSLDRMADHYERKHDFEMKIRAATTYPLLVTGVALAVAAVMVVFVLPRFKAVFAALGVEMPLASRILLQVGLFLQNHWLVFLFLTLALSSLLLLLAGTGPGRQTGDYLRLNLPVLGSIYRKTTTARFAYTLSALLAGGVTLYNAIFLAGRTMDNVLLAGSITAMGRALERGEPLSASLRSTPYFPPLLAAMVHVGEETGTLENALARAAVYYEKESAYAAERLGTVLEPLLLLAVGFFVGLLVYSILSPLYEVFQII